MGLQTPLLIWPVLEAPVVKDLNVKDTLIAYFQNITQAFVTLLQGLRLTLQHFYQARISRKLIDIEEVGYFEQQKGIVTLQYPYETLPVPDHGRYQLHNEIDDCIVCDKCAKACPVNCINIEAIRSAEEIGKTSDGTPKRLYAARFDIDMAKCCFCGLCTVVCPTECLTMTPSYDFSVFDIQAHNFEFGHLSNEQVTQKKADWEAHQAKKQKAKAQVPTESEKEKPKKPVFKSVIKTDTTAAKPPQTKANFRPKVKPKDS